MLETFVILFLWLAAMAGLYVLFTRRSRARVARERIFATQKEASSEEDLEDGRDPFLTAWLVRAGYRAPGSAQAFVLATLVCLLVGAFLGFLLATTELFRPLVARASQTSAGFGSMVETLVLILPWVIFVGVALTPWTIVRRRRRRRVLSIDNELPMVLELLATMSEAGLGFDASFTKILQNERRDSPLMEELRLFQLESLAGVARIRCFRRLTRRCEVSSMTIFCSAMIQAEQVGAGFSSVLRTQATDLRGRRRERAMIKAQALPVKLVFPLVICFLPAIFVITLGPAFMEFFDLAGGILRGGA